MAYDKASFLAGLAVGRNMESWPAMKGENVFKFTVRVPAGLYYSPWMVFDGTIYWGDGTSSTYDNIPSNYEESEAFRGRTSHSYSVAGLYQISLVGTLLDWSIIQNATSLIYSDELVSIDTPFPRSMSEKTFLTGICYGCRSLVKLPPKLFKNCPALKNLASFCWRCSALQELPDKLFSGCMNVTNVNRFFMSCDLAEIPSDLFAQMTEVENASGMISYNRRIRDIPHGLLDPLHNLKYPIGLNSMGINSIPTGFFANCPDIEVFDNLCYDSPVTDIPADIFYYTPIAYSFRYTFAQTAITDIPSGLFSRCPLASDFSSCFEGCVGIYGEVPKLWERFPDANGNDCFYGCVNALNYDEIPDGWK